MLCFRCCCCLFLFYFILIFIFFISFNFNFVVVVIIIIFLLFFFYFFFFFAVLEYFEKTHQGVYLEKQSVSLETGKDKFICILQTISSDLFWLFSLVRLHLAIYKSRSLCCLVDFNNNDDNNL